MSPPRFDHYTTPIEYSSAGAGCHFSPNQLFTCFHEETIDSHEGAEALFTSIVDDGVVWQGKVDGAEYELRYAGGSDDTVWYEEVISTIEGLTSGLHECFPEYFCPYLFATRFDELAATCARYEIPIPEVPGKLQKRERALYYLAVNRAFQEFRRQAGLSPPELNAFLYDFAPKDLARKETGVLPQPSRIWFVMGGINNNGDFQYLDAATESSIAHWQGNLETRRGDIVLMWCVSPRSSMHSVWRAICDGFNDPYFGFYSTIRVGCPIKIPPIKFAELARHPQFAEHPAVRAHFQGRGGMAFTVEEYDVIREMLRAKGFDDALLPPAPQESPLPDVKLTDERDVEVHLVEPLLKRLAYGETEWRYQFRIRMGRGERNVPDYVLGAIDIPGEESGVALIESKFNIDDKKSRREAFVQGKSYALRLEAEAMALAARQGLWVFRLTSHGFDEDQFMFKTWQELQHPDKLAEVDRVLGKRAIDAEVAARQRRMRSGKPR